MKLRFLLPAMHALQCCACITHIRPSVTENTPPHEALSAFQHFQLEPAVGTTPAVSKQTGAMAKIAANTQMKLQTAIRDWENKSQSGRTLKIEPRVTERKFVSGTKSVFADPALYRRASAPGGAWSLGGTDNGMLVRISTVAQKYMQRTFSTEKGGRRGSIPAAQTSPKRCERSTEPAPTRAS